MNILVLTSTFPRWQNDSEPRFVDYLCQNLAEQATVHVIAPHARGAAREEAIGRVSVFRFRYCLESWQTLAYGGGILPNLRENPLRFLLVPPFLLSQWWLATRLLRRNHYDVIHAHWIIPQGLVAILARCLASSPPPVALTSHGGDLFALRGEPLTRLKSWITRRADALTVVSDVMKRRAAVMGLQEEARISNIPMGVDSRGIFTPPATDTERNGLLFVGRLVDKKGVEYLLRAMPAILARHPDEQLTIIGDGPLRAPLGMLCRELGIAGNVTFRGSLTNREIPPHLQRAAIAIFPSIVTDAGDQEGSPVAIMEALACGCAAIVADYPGAGDLISHGDTGIIVPGKSPDALAAAVLALLDAPGDRHALGRRGRAWVQAHYDWRVISGRFMDLFRALAAG